MKFQFGKISMERYMLLDSKLQKVAFDSLHLGIMDFTIVCSYRSEEDQNKAFMKGKSKLKWPLSKHNNLPSTAMDIAPWINGKISGVKVHCCVLAGIILATAAANNIKLRWGGNWDMDSEPITDQDFQDLWHFERV